MLQRFRRSAAECSGLPHGIKFSLSRRSLSKLAVSLTTLLHIFTAAFNASLEPKNAPDVIMEACGTLKCENAAICEKVAKCENNSTLNVKIDAICEKITLNVKKIRLSKCVKYFDSKCVKIDAICANFILTLFVKI